jgi:hypothetical protein
MITKVIAMLLGIKTDHIQSTRKHTHQEEGQGDATVNQSYKVPSFVEKYAQEQRTNYPETQKSRIVCYEDDGNTREMQRSTS